MSLVNKDLWIDPSEIESEKIRFSAHLLIGASVLLLAVFLLWAHFAVLDQITRGDGKVIPSRSTQVIQNLDGGILSRLMVREGDIVEKDQIIALIENSAAKYNLSELKQRYYAALAASTRLQAQIDGVTDRNGIVFPDELKQAAPEVVEAELILFDIKAHDLTSQIATIEQQIAQRKNELVELQVKMESTDKQLALAQRQFDIMKPLRDKKAVSEIEVLRMRQQMAGYESENSATEASIPRAKAALQESHNKLEELKGSARSVAAQELAKQRLELATVKEAIADANAKVSRTEVRSPLRGAVKEIKIKTEGGVVQPAAPIMEIVPIDDTLLIEAQISPIDRGFIAPNQKAVIKITAYDFSIYGGLDAVVEDISADTIENEKREQFFRVKLRTDKNELIDNKTGEPLRIIPGMTASVDILTGQKTVLQYLLKPILKAQESLTER